MKAPSYCRREAKQRFRACLVNGLLDEDLARKTVESIVTRKSRGFRITLSHFLRLVKLYQTQHTVTIQSAQPLPADLQASVQADVARLYGSGLTTSFATNPALIGGMRIQVGSDVYDGSVCARLAALEKTF